MTVTIAKQLTLLPNVLTLGRIVTVPFILIFIDNQSVFSSFIAALLYGLSAVTDLLDGYLARRSKQISLLGQLLDPLADKILVMATLVWMVQLGRVEAWIVVLLLAREFSITSLRGIASAQGLVIAAKQKGKEKTAFQLIGILCLIIHFPYPVLFTPYFIDFHVVGLYTIYISLVLSIFSAIEYLQLFARAVRKVS